MSLTAQTFPSLQSQRPYKHLNTYQDLTRLRVISEKKNASIEVVIPINYVDFFLISRTQNEE